MEKIILKLNNDRELNGIKNEYGFLIFLNEKITLKLSELTEEIKQTISELDENKIAHISFYTDAKVMLSLKMLNFILNNFGFEQKDKFFKMFYFKTNELKKTDKVYLVSYFTNTVSKLEIDTIKQFLQNNPNIEKTTFARIDTESYFKIQPKQTFNNLVYLTVFKNKSKNNANN